MDNERNNYAFWSLCNRVTVGAHSVRPKPVLFYVSWEHTVLPYDVDCANRLIRYRLL